MKPGPPSRGEPGGRDLPRLGTDWPELTREPAVSSPCAPARLLRAACTAGHVPRGGTDATRSPCAGGRGQQWPVGRAPHRPCGRRGGHVHRGLHGDPSLATCRDSAHVWPHRLSPSEGKGPGSPLRPPRRPPRLKPPGKQQRMSAAASQGLGAGRLIEPPARHAGSVGSSAHVPSPSCWATGKQPRGPEGHHQTCREQAEGLVWGGPGHSGSQRPEHDGRLCACGWWAVLTEATFLWKRSVASATCSGPPATSSDRRAAGGT